ncbi:hypothetical protein MBANPS3_003968 [Mucor bainieri]
MAANLTGRAIYLVTYAIRRDYEGIDPKKDGGGAVFSTYAEAKAYMINFGRELYWNNMDVLPSRYDFHAEYPEPEPNGCDREYGVYENHITMQSHSTDDYTDDHAYAFVKITKTHIDNVDPGEGHSYTPFTEPPPANNTTARQVVPNQNDITGRVAYLVSYGTLGREQEEVEPDDGRGAVFTTKAKAKEHMKKLAKELCWRDDCYEPDFDKFEPPRDDFSGRQFCEEDDIIRFSVDTFDGIELEQYSGYTKVTKVHINNVVPGVGESFAPNADEPSSKKRKASNASIP